MKIRNFIETGPFSEEFCCDCGRPNPLFRGFGSSVPKGCDTFFCEECMNIRERYQDENSEPLPLHVICDDCNTDSHNPHNCKKTDIFVGGVKTKKSCSCEECNGVLKFLGLHF